jgi:hypothetical protein
MHHMPALEAVPDRPRPRRREPTARLARDYEVSASSLYRHRRYCLKLDSSRDIKHEAARGSAALELLPGREAVSGQYLQLCERIDQIVQQAHSQNSLTVALNGLNSIKRTLDSVSRLAGHDRPPSENVQMLHVGLGLPASACAVLEDHRLRRSDSAAQAALDQRAQLDVMRWGIAWQTPRGIYHAGPGSDEDRKKPAGGCPAGLEFAEFPTR